MDLNAVHQVPVICGINLQLTQLSQVAIPQ